MAQAGLDASMPENSMDADPVTSDDAVAELAYEAMIGSEFERIRAVRRVPAFVGSRQHRDEEVKHEITCHL